MKKPYNSPLNNAAIVKMTNENYDIEKFLKKHLVALDDKFKFDCKNCNKLCKGHSGQILYPHDIYAMSKALGITTSAFFDKYCEMCVTSQMLMPHIKLKVIGNDKYCILHKNGICQVSNDKPLSCSTYPLAVFVAGTETQKTITGYLLDISATSSRGETYTVREWLAYNDVDEKDEFTADFVEICELVQNTLLQDRKGMVAQDIRGNLADAILGFLYKQYDTELDFSEQFLANKQKLQEICNQIHELKNNKY